MEEQFYILWPTFLLLVRRGARIPATVMLIVAIVAWRCYLVFQGVDPERTYNGFDTHADALLLGCVLSFAGDRLKLPANGVWSILAVVGTGLLFALMEHRTVFAQTAGLSIAGLLSVLVIVCARQPGWLRNLLQLPPLVFTGRISYGIYLWHYVLLTVTRSHFPGLLLCVPIAMAYLAAAASFFIVEQPILRLKNRWRTAAYRPAEQSGPLRLSES
jgi:peptidoglycan/LPS O-acetylase OafA/YrhL